MGEQVPVLEADGILPVLGGQRGHHHSVREGIALGGAHPVASLWDDWLSYLLAQLVCLCGKLFEVVALHIAVGMVVAAKLGGIQWHRAIVGFAHRAYYLALFELLYVRFALPGVVRHHDVYIVICLQFNIGDDNLQEVASGSILGDGTFHIHIKATEQVVHIEDGMHAQIARQAVVHIILASAQEHLHGIALWCLLHCLVVLFVGVVGETVQDVVRSVQLYAGNNSPALLGVEVHWLVVHAKQEELVSVEIVADIILAVHYLALFVEELCVSVLVVDSQNLVPEHSGRLVAILCCFVVGIAARHIAGSQTEGVEAC